MKPKASKRTHAQPLIGARLELLVDLDHERVRLASAIDWAGLETAFGRLYVADVGRPGIRVRLMAGLVLLQHTFGCSDEEVVKRWPENPYWQFFCGEEFFQHRLPIHPSQLSRWRKRIGEAGCEKLLSLTIDAGKRTKTITESSCEKVIVDTTVQPKAIQHPTDARLYRKVHGAMLRIAEAEGIKLRQSHRRLMERAFRKHGGHAKAKQSKDPGQAQASFGPDLDPPPHPTNIRLMPHERSSGVSQGRLASFCSILDEGSPCP
jgi:IS5 family transposase